MSRGKQKSYDDEALVLDIAQGNLTYEQIAKRHGLSAAFVGEIARGEARAELQQRLGAVTDGLRAQARRIGVQLANAAMARLGTLVTTTAKVDADTRRKAAVDILKFAIGDPSKTEVNVKQQQGLPGLDADDLEALAKRKGGPK